VLAVFSASHAARHFSGVMAEMLTRSRIKFRSNLPTIPMITERASPLRP